MTEKECLACDKPIGGSDRCGCDYFFDQNNKVSKRIVAEKNCPTCKVKKGQPHHWNCDQELCPDCGKNVIDSDKCLTMWMDACDSSKTTKEEKAEIYYVTTARFILYTLLSFGLYSFYWIYRTWKFFIVREKLDLNPVVLTVFSPIFIFLLARKIKSLAQENYYYEASVVVAPILFNVFLLVGATGGENFWLIPFIFIPLLNLHQELNNLYRIIAPDVLL